MTFFFFSSMSSCRCCLRVCSQKPVCDFHRGQDVFDEPCDCTGSHIIHIVKLMSVPVGFNCLWRESESKNLKKNQQIIKARPCTETVRLKFMEQIKSTAVLNGINTGRHCCWFQSLELLLTLSKSVALCHRDGKNELTTGMLRLKEE